MRGRLRVTLLVTLAVAWAAPAWSAPAPPAPGSASAAATAVPVAVAAQSAVIVDGFDSAAGWTAQPADGVEMKLSFDRQARTARELRAGWWLHSITVADAV